MHVGHTMIGSSSVINVDVTAPTGPVWAIKQGYHTNKLSKSRDDETYAKAVGWMTKKS